MADTKKIADGVKDLALTLQEGSCALQYEQDAMRQKLLSLDMDSRALDVKIQGIPESTDKSADLQIIISNWMASILGLEDGIAPSLTRVRRLGSPNNAKRKGPWT